MFENLSFNIVPRGGDRAGEIVERKQGRDGWNGTKTANCGETACAREEKLNGRRRELPGN